MQDEWEKGEGSERRERDREWWRGEINTRSGGIRRVRGVKVQQSVVVKEKNMNWAQERGIGKKARKRNRENI